MTHKIVVNHSPVTGSCYTLLPVTSTRIDRNYTCGTGKIQTSKQQHKKTTRQHAAHKVNKRHFIEVNQPYCSQKQVHLEITEVEIIPIKCRTSATTKRQRDEIRRSNREMKYIAQREGLTPTDYRDEPQAPIVAVMVKMHEEHHQITK